MEQEQGFTLMELVIVLAIVGILVTVGIPNMTATIQNNQLTSEVNRFVAQLQLARSEAIKRGRTVTLCRSNDVTDSSPSCSGTSGVYEQGWLMYVNASGSDDNYDSSTDTLLQVSGPAANGVTIRSNSIGNAWLSFNSIGMLVKTSSAELRFCGRDGSTAAVLGRQLAISLTGQARTLKMDADAACTPS